MLKSLKKHKITPKHAPNSSPSDPPPVTTQETLKSVDFPIEPSMDLPTVRLKDPQIDPKGF